MPSIAIARMNFFKALNERWLVMSIRPYVWAIPELGELRPADRCLLVKQGLKKTRWHWTRFAIELGFFICLGCLAFGFAMIFHLGLSVPAVVLMGLSTGRLESYIRGLTMRPYIIAELSSRSMAGGGAKSN